LFKEKAIMPVSIAAWAKIQGCNPSTISERIKRGMAPEQAIFGGK
jgi:hypothetical protein